MSGEDQLARRFGLLQRHAAHLADLVERSGVHLSPGDMFVLDRVHELVATPERSESASEVPR